MIPPCQPPDIARCRVVASCPGCGGSESVVVGDAAPAFDTSVAGRALRHPAFGIRCCSDCGLYFKSHTLPVEELASYYARLNAEPFDIEGKFPTDLALHGLLDRLPAGRRILDFGCSTGRILRELTNRHECLGVEINERAAATARARGVRIVTEEQVRLGEQGDFDAIILADVYEHLLQPTTLLAILANALNKNARLAIVTGNADAIRTRDRMAEFWYFQLPGHLQMMSEKHVHWLADRLDVRIEELHRCSHYDTPIIQRAKQYLQSFAYHRFRRRPLGLIGNVLRFVPVLSRAERWSKSPALNFTPDHFVIVFQKP